MGKVMVVDDAQSDLRLMESILQSGGSFWMHQDASIAFARMQLNGDLSGYSPFIVSERDVRPASVELDVIGKLLRGFVAEPLAKLFSEG